MTVPRPDDDGRCQIDLTTSPDGSPVIVLTGELDLGEVDRVAAAVEPVLARAPERLVVDVSGIEFADSSAIALWVRWAARVRRIELRDPPALLRRVLETMGLAVRLGVSP